jgi:hypothetical protein
VLLDQLHRHVVQGSPADADARRGAEPVKDSGASAATPMFVLVDDVRAFVAALVAGEAKDGQGYFLFCARGFAGAARLARAVGLDAGAVLTALVFAALFLALAADGLAAAAGEAFPADALAGRGSAGFLASGAGARWTSVNRVWSPIVWKLQISATFTPFSAARRRAMSTHPAGT